VAAAAAQTSAPGVTECGPVWHSLLCGVVASGVTELDCCCAEPMKLLNEGTLKGIFFGN